jgi:hypothetical protein
VMRSVEFKREIKIQTSKSNTRSAKTHRIAPIWLFTSLR